MCGLETWRGWKYKVLLPSNLFKREFIKFSIMHACINIRIGLDSSTICASLTMAYKSGHTSACYSVS